MSDYYDIAIKDFTNLVNAQIYDGNYNMYAANYSNMVEKLLKSVVVLVNPTDELTLHSHKLTTIYNSLLKQGVDLDLDESLLALVGGFYFDARYPGENYVEVSEKKYKQCGRCAKEVLDAVNDYREKAGLPTRLPKLYKRESNMNEIWKEYCERYAIKPENEVTEMDRLMMLYNCEGEALFQKIKEDLL